MPTITSARVSDVRFPTSDALDGSDAMNEAPDYSAAYVVLETDEPGLEGHGLAFTIGRGTEIVVRRDRGLRAARRRAPARGPGRRPGRDLAAAGTRQPAALARPREGRRAPRGGALVNAVWDLWARAERKPLWKLLADLRPSRSCAASTSATSTTR